MISPKIPQVGHNSRTASFAGRGHSSRRTLMILLVGIIITITWATKMSTSGHTSSLRDTYYHNSDSITSPNINNNNKLGGADNVCRSEEEIIRNYENTRPRDMVPMVAPIVSPPEQIITYKEKEPVVLSLIVYGENTAKETGILLKSAILYTSSPLDFHLICDPESQEALTALFNLIHSPVYDIRVFFYPLSWEAMNGRLSRTARPKEGYPEWGRYASVHDAGTPGMMKILIHEILPETVTRAIFVDSDAFFMTDPTLLWREFSYWNESTILEIPLHPEGAGHTDPWNGASQICSCIFLMDLERMREAKYIDSSLFSASDREKSLSPPAVSWKWGEPDPSDGVYRNVLLGDQGYMYAIQQYYPDRHRSLPLSWEVTSCLMHNYEVGMWPNEDDASEEQQIRGQKHLENTGFENSLIIPNIVHFNCLNVARYYESPQFDGEDPIAIRYGDSLRYHLKYKWIWFNRGDGSKKVTISTAKDLRFYDERQAGHTTAFGYPKVESTTTTPTINEQPQPVEAQAQVGHDGLDDSIPEIGIPMMEDHHNDDKPVPAVKMDINRELEPALGMGTGPGLIGKNIVGMGSHKKKSGDDDSEEEEFQD